jgi:transketolase
MNDIDFGTLKGIANQLRIHSINTTTAAGSGHPSSCCSAADLVAALFFGHMRYDPKNPRYYNNDRFILSKGHAAPLLYAAWAEAGLFPLKNCSNCVSLTPIWKATPRRGFRLSMSQRVLWVTA